MSRPEIPVQPVAAKSTSGAAPAVPRAGWQASRLLVAPHRVSFFCAVLVLVAASLWWLLVQWDRVWGPPGLSSAVPQTITHAAVMVFGFMPLFFSGFLFTAGPNWLHVKPYQARQLAPALVCQAAGWGLWLIGAFASRQVAIAGVFLACAGLVWMYALYWRLVLASTVADRAHAKAIGCGGIVGCLSLGGIGVCLVLGQDALTIVFARTALWGFIAVTFCSVAHRMIPFFTHNVVPSVALWRPLWILWLMLGVAAFEVVRVWVEVWAPLPQMVPAWTFLSVAVELVTGAILLWLALAWGLVQSARNHLLVMLHIGFAWLGLALIYAALAQALWITSGSAVLGVGALHALSMGFMGSLILAMVTRVTCGHSGRPLVADRMAWGLFLLLQVTVVVRLLAAVQGIPVGWTVLAALLWALVVTLWGLRFADWYGKPRVDGKPG